MGKEKEKRAIFIERKKNIIEAVCAGRKQIDIVTEFDITTSTSANILKENDKNFKPSEESNICPEKKEITHWRLSKV